MPLFFAVERIAIKRRDAPFSLLYKERKVGGKAGKPGKTGALNMAKRGGVKHEKSGDKSGQSLGVFCFLRSLFPFFEVFFYPFAAFLRLFDLAFW